MTLRRVSPDQKRVSLSLGKAPAGVLPQPGNYRDYATGKKQGYLRYKLGEVKQADMPVNTPTEVEFQAAYGDGNDLKPGDEVDVVSAWEGDYSPHVWGMTRFGVNSQDTRVVLPGPKANPSTESPK